MTIDDRRRDADLARAHVAGDRQALAAIYDRHAPGLYDTAAAMLRDRDAAGDVVQDVFCTAAVKLGQLRDPERLKPWLYAIARHEIYRRSATRKRSVSLDTVVAESGREPVAADHLSADGRGQIGTELAAVVRGAAAGLDAEDQLVLELSARQGLSGADLAAALGVASAPAANKLVFRMRQRLERAVGAYVVTRGSRRRCDELATVLRGWDGTFDVLWRKRIARHIDDCDTCQETRRGAAVLSLASAAPALLLPAGLRPRVLEAAEQLLVAAGSSGPGSSGGSGSGGAGPGTGAAEYGTGGDDATVAFALAGPQTIKRWRSDGFPGDAGDRRLLFAVRLGAIAAFVAVALLAVLQLGNGRDDGQVPAVDAPLVETTADVATTADATTPATPPAPTATVVIVTAAPTAPPPVTRPPATPAPTTQPPTTQPPTQPDRTTVPSQQPTTTLRPGTPPTFTIPRELVVVPGNSFFVPLLTTTTAPFVLN